MSLFYIDMLLINLKSNDISYMRPHNPGLEPEDNFFIK